MPKKNVSRERKMGNEKNLGWDDKVGKGSS